MWLQQLKQKMVRFLQAIVLKHFWCFSSCAERAAAFNMFQQSGQTTIKRIIAFRDKAPNGGGSGMPCGACREFLMQLSPKNKKI